MDERATKALMEQKLDEHGLLALGWTAHLDRAVRRFGACLPEHKQITVSRKLAAMNSDEQVLDTILHEIAHALAYLKTGRNCGHNATWKRIARDIGAKPSRCFDADEVKMPAGRYFMINRDTAEIYRTYHRKPQIKRLSTAWVRGQKAETRGKLMIVGAAELATRQGRGSGAQGTGNLTSEKATSG